MLYKTNYTQQSFSDSKKLLSVKKLENPLFIGNLRIKRDRSSYFRADKPYDFTEAYRISDTESFVSISISKKKNLILKDGYKFISENMDDIKYVQYRLNEIAYYTEIHTSTLLDEIIGSVLHNHNAFVFVKRDDRFSSGEIRKEEGVKLKPIAGLFTLSETKTELIENNYNAVIGYKYNLTRGVYNEFKKKEVLHLYVNKKPDLNVGTPPFEAVKDDILSLRQIEESLERLIYKLSCPLIHASVGSPEMPAGVDIATGRLEIDVVNDQILEMEDAGGITTTDRVSIKLLGAESQALRLSSYIEHFKNRVLVGLTTSDVDLGIGTTTTGGAASVVSEALRQNVEMYQNLVETFFTDYIITPILLEKPSNVGKLFLSEEEKVVFKFNRTNLDNKVKLESHYVNEYNADLITNDEYRNLTGKRPLSKKEKEENLKEKGKHPDQLKPPVTGVAAKPKSSTNPTTNSTSPKNQHNKSAVKDDLDIEYYVNNIKQGRVEAANKTMSKSIYEHLEPFVSITIEDCDQFVRPLTNTLKTYIIENINDYGVINRTVKNVIYKNILEYMETNSK